MLKVMFHTDPPLGRALHDIERQLSSRAPDGVEIVKSVLESPDLVVEHMIGDMSTSRKVRDVEALKRMRDRPYVVLFNGFGCPVRKARAHPFFTRMFAGARMVFTPWPMAELYGYGPAGNIVEEPWGYDHESYYYEGEAGRGNALVTTGHVASMECIEEVYEACRDASYVQHHVGHDFRWDKGTCKHYEGISNDEMRTLYHLSRFVSGLRRGEGFEIPIIEGAACGARPIVFENPHYKWFNGLATFIREGEFSEVRESVRELLNGKMSSGEICQDKRAAVRKAFGWDVVAKTFWTELMRRV